MCVIPLCWGEVYVIMHFCPSVPIYTLEYLRACASSPSHLFAFPEHQVHEAADESHGEADPSQDVGGAVGALLKTGHMKALFPICVDGRRDHHTYSWKEERGGGPSASLSPAAS